MRAHVLLLVVFGSHCSAFLHPMTAGRHGFPIITLDETPMSAGSYFFLVGDSHDVAYEGCLARHNNSLRQPVERSSPLELCLQDYMDAHLLDFYVPKDLTE